MSDPVDFVRHVARLSMPGDADYGLKNSTAQQARLASLVAEARGILAQPQPSPASVQPSAEVREALEMTGCRDLADLIDHANIGRSFLAASEMVTSSEGPFKGWVPAEDPAELLVDLENALHDALATPEPPAPASGVEGLTENEWAITPATRPDLDWEKDGWNDTTARNLATRPAQAGTGEPDRVRVLEGALEPFANFGRAIATMENAELEDTMPIEAVSLPGGKAVVICVGHFRRAAALAAQPTPAETGGR